MPAANALKIVRANREARQKKMTELRELDERATAEERPFSEEETAQALELRSELDDINTRTESLVEMELRSTQIDDGLAGLLGVIEDRDSGELVDNRSIGERFTQADGYGDWAGHANGKFQVDFENVDMRAVTDTTYGATSGGALTRPERLSRIGRDFLDRRVYLLDLLPHINTNQNAVEYVQDKSPLADVANKAVEVTEGSAKPQTGITTAVVTESMANIAAWANITRQVAMDIPQVQSYLDGRIRYSLKRRSDLQSISGDGIAPNLKGLANRTGILTNAPGSAEARYVTIRHSITLMENAEAVPQIIVLNPADAELFDLSNSTTAGLHAVMDNDLAGGSSALAGPVSRTAWGLTQVHSTAIASGTALLVDPMAVAVIDRMAPTAFMTDSHASNFTSNILTLLLELRMGLALFDPNGVLKVTFNGTT